MTENIQEGCTVQPQTKEELAAIIYETCQEKGWDCDLNFIDTSKITDMSYLFAGDENYGFGLSEFNGNISNWDTSNVTDMSGMFCDAKYFNGTLNYWDTSNVTNMESMFECAKSFNQPLNNWDLSGIRFIENMLSGTKSFKSELPDFKNYRRSEEELLEKLGLPPDFKPEIKKEQEQEMAHKKGMCR